MGKAFWDAEVQVGEDITKSTVKSGKTVFRVKLVEKSGQKYVDLREFPSFKGVAITIEDLPAVIRRLLAVKLDKKGGVYPNVKD